MTRSISAGMYALFIVAAISLVGCGGGGKSATTTTTNINSTPLSPAEYVYAVNSLGNSISQYQIAANGALLPLTTPSVPTGERPIAIAADTKGRFLYVANNNDGTISQYQIGADGVLTPLSPATVPAGTVDSASGNGLRSLVADASGRFVYVNNLNESNLRVYTIGSNGGLQTGHVVPNITATSFIVAHPQLPVLYIGGDTVAQYQIGADGNLTPLNPAVVQAPTGPIMLSLTPNGKFAYLGFDGSTTPAQYQVNADGTLAVLDLANSNIPTDSSTSSIPNVDPGSRFVYTLTAGSSGLEILGSRIGTDGSLIALTPPAIQLGLTEFLGLTFDPSGQFVYAPGPLSNSLLGFRIGSDGTLSTLPMPTVETGSGPSTALSVQRTTRRRGVPGAYGAHTFVTVRRPLP